MKGAVVQVSDRSVEIRVDAYVIRATANAGRELEFFGILKQKPEEITWTQYLTSKCVQFTKQ